MHIYHPGWGSYRMVQLKKKLKNFPAPLVKNFRSRGNQNFCLGNRDDGSESKVNENLRLYCMILLITSVKVANGKKRARQVKGRGVIAVVSQRVKLFATEACLQGVRYLNK